MGLGQLTPRLSRNSPHYNLGFALHFKGDLDPAIELDPAYYIWARRNTDYDPIRDDPAFRMLVYAE